MILIKIKFKRKK